MRLLLQFFSLSDRYERKVRLLPGLLLAAVPALTAGAVLQEFASWQKAASSAVGVEFLAAIILGQFARGGVVAASKRFFGRRGAALPRLGGCALGIKPAPTSRNRNGVGPSSG